MDDILRNYLNKKHEDKYGKNISSIQPSVKKKGYDAVVEIVSANSENSENDIIIKDKVKKVKKK